MLSSFSEDSDGKCQGKAGHRRRQRGGRKSRKREGRRRSRCDLERRRRLCCRASRKTPTASAKEKLVIERDKEVVVKVGSGRDEEEVGATWKGGGDYVVELLGKSTRIDVNDRSRALTQIEKMGLSRSQAAELLAKIPPQRPLVSFGVEGETRSA